MEIIYFSTDIAVTRLQKTTRRWTEQWLPHAAWFLQAVTAMSVEK